MNCDIAYLIEQACAFKCVPKSSQRDIALYLMCRWAADERVNTCFKYVGDWAARVVAAGGDMPSQKTQDALCTFLLTFLPNNSLDRYYVFFPIVPDSFIAATTPIVVIGNQPQDPVSYPPSTWVNHGFTAANFSTDGITGNGAAYFDTGFVPSTFYINDETSGVSVYFPSAISAVADQVHIGSNDVAGGAVANMSFSASKLGVMNWDCYNNVVGQGRNTKASVGLKGYFSANRYPGSLSRVFFANGATPHGNFSTIATTGGTRPNSTLYAWGYNNVGVASNLSTDTIGFIAIHKPLTLAKSLELYDAIVTLRTKLGQALA